MLEMFVFPPMVFLGNECSAIVLDSMRHHMLCLCSHRCGSVISEQQGNKPARLVCIEIRGYVIFQGVCGHMPRSNPNFQGCKLHGHGSIHWACHQPGSMYHFFYLAPMDVTCSKGVPRTTPAKCQSHIESALVVERKSKQGFFEHWPSLTTFLNHSSLFEMTKQTAGKKKEQLCYRIFRTIEWTIPTSKNQSRLVSRKTSGRVVQQPLKCWYPQIIHF